MLISRASWERPVAGIGFSTSAVERSVDNLTNSGLVGLLAPLAREPMSFCRPVDRSILVGMPGLMAVRSAWRRSISACCEALGPAGGAGVAAGAGAELPELA